MLMIASLCKTTYNNIKKDRCLVKIFKLYFRLKYGYTFLFSVLMIIVGISFIFYFQDFRWSNRNLALRLKDHSGIVILGSIMLEIMVLLFFGYMIVLKKKKLKVMTHWLALKRNEEVFLLILCMLPWIIGCALIFLFMCNAFVRRHLCFSFICLFAPVLCEFFLMSGKDRLWFLLPDKKEGNIWVPRFYIFDLIAMAIKRRCRNIGYVFSEIFFITMSIVPAVFNMDSGIIYYMGVLIFLAVAMDDFYWMDEMKNFSFYSTNGIGFISYQCVELAAAFLVRVIPVLIGGFINLTWKDVLVLVLLLGLMIAFWNNVYIYLGRFREHLGVRNWLCIAFSIFMCIPVVNIITYGYVFQKNRKMWI